MQRLRERVFTRRPQQLAHGLCFNTKHELQPMFNLLACKGMTRRSKTGTMVDRKELFATALRRSQLKSVLSEGTGDACSREISLALAFSWPSDFT